MIYILLIINVLIALVNGQSNYSKAANNDTANNSNYTVTTVERKSITDNDSNKTSVRTEGQDQVASSRELWDRAVHTAIPTHYDLLLNPDLQMRNYSGHVRILVNLTEVTKYFVLHALHLDISEVKARVADGRTELSVGRSFLVEEKEYLIIELNYEVEVGIYEMSLEFSGTMNNDGTGFYKHTYWNTVAESGRAFAAANFKDSSARTVFPCFDEPAFMATFNISVIHQKDQLVLSNAMERVNSRLENGQIITTFEKTVPMATHSICFVVGNFHYTELYTEEDIRLRVYSRMNDTDKTSYVLLLGHRLLMFIEKYLGYAYPLKKLDILAVPNSYHGSGYLGLTLIEEELYLVDNFEMPLFNRVQITKQLAHKLAEMWLGNLVTVSRWSDWWLTESLASFVAAKATDVIDPTWNEELSLVYTTSYQSLLEDCSTSWSYIKGAARTQSSMDIPTVCSGEEAVSLNTLDGLPEPSCEKSLLFRVLFLSSQEECNMSWPMLDSQKDAAYTFDSCTHNKGISIIKMLATFMGEDFRKGVFAFLKKYAYHSFNALEFWSELTDASSRDISIADLTSTWTTQMNHPYIKVERNEASPEELTLNVRLAPASDRDCEELPNEWQVPISYYTANDSSVQFLVLNSTDKLTLKVSEKDWIKFNVNFTGPYIVDYGTEGWKHITWLFKNNHSVFSPADRANLLYDSFALAAVKLIPYDIPLNLSTYIRRERHFLPWSIAYEIFTDIHGRLREESATAMLRQHFKSLSRELHEELAWEDTGEYAERELRNLMIRVACDSGNSNCLRKVQSIFHAWLNGKKIDAHYRHLIYIYGARLISDEVSTLKMWGKYSTETDVGEKRGILKGLANVNNETFVKWLLNSEEMRNKIGRNDYLQLLKEMSEVPAQQSILVEFLEENFATLLIRYMLSSNELLSLVDGIFRSCKTSSCLLEVKNFFHKNLKVGDGNSYKEQTINVLRHNFDWIMRNEMPVTHWLENNVYMPWQAMRLPSHVAPSSYDIIIQLDKSCVQFNGTVNVSVTVKHEADYIVVQSQLNVSKAELWSVEEQIYVRAMDIFDYKINDFLVLHFNKNLKTGEYSLYMEFAGHTRQHQKGILRGFYNDTETNEQRCYVHTLFEPVLARTAFPCFDEPGFKAKFRLSLIHDSNKFAVSNMPEENRTVFPNGLTETKFMETVQMSTYVLTFVVSDFDYLEAELGGRGKIRYFARPAVVNKTLHALNVTSAYLKTLEEYFGIPYHIPKLDFVAIPNIVTGAMENWGLITYRESHLIDDSMTTDRVMRSDKTICHELAHQWFGNMVTMRWWSDIWLNEGISSFIQYIPLRKLYSGVDEFRATQSTDMISIDAARDSHALVMDVREPAEIWKAFGPLTYRKGSALLTMIETVMKDDLQQGLTNFLKRYSYGNADTMDFLMELDKASTLDVNITDVMLTWIYQKNLPYVTVERNTTNCIVTQKRFTNEGVPNYNTKESPFGYVWKIPLTYMDLETGESRIFWLNSENETLSMNTTSETCLKFNLNFTGYYLTNYDAAGWDCLAKRLQRDHQSLSVIDRYSILNDAIRLRAAGIIPYDVVLDLTKYLRKERSWLPWRDIDRFFHEILERLRKESETVEMLRRYLLYITEELYDEFGENGTGRMDFDSIVNCMGIISHHPKVVDVAQSALRKWMEKKILPEADNMFGLATHHYGNETLWEEIWDQLNRTNSSMQTERRALVEGLVNFKEKAFAKKNFHRALSQEDLDSGIMYSVLQKVARYQWTISAMCDEMDSNWEAFFASNTSKSHENLLQEMCESTRTKEDVERMKHVLYLHHHILSPMMEYNCQSSMKSNLQWLEEHESIIDSWLQKGLDWHQKSYEAAELHRPTHYVESPNHTIEITNTGSMGPMRDVFPIFSSLVLIAHINSFLGP